MNTEQSGRCGCGSEARYTTPSGDSCNKYMRCQTYDELKGSLLAANQLLAAYRKKRSVDGLNGRKWDAFKHYEAEVRIEKLEAQNE